MFKKIVNPETFNSYKYNWGLYIKINYPIKISVQHNSSFSKNFWKVQRCQFLFEQILIWSFLGSIFY